MDPPVARIVRGECMAEAAGVAPRRPCRITEMLAHVRMARTGLLVWLLLNLAAAALLVRWDIAQRREAFLTDARIAHRLLSQRAAQHEAILHSLVLLSPAAPAAERPLARLVALYPQLLAVLRRSDEQGWPDAAWSAAEAKSRASGHAVTAHFNGAETQYTLVLAGLPASHALRIDARQMLPWDTWPLARGGPVQALLVHGDQAMLLQAGEPPSSRPRGLTAGFVFSKPLDVAGQGFELRLQRATGPAEWPWGWMASLALGSALALLALAGWRGQRLERHRREARLRFDQVARLNTLGALAAGIAHELNQPLAAVLASTQAATRVLADEPPDLADLSLARQAMAHATAQAQRASQVLTRLRRGVERPDLPPTLEPVDLVAAVHALLDLLAPECQHLSVAAQVRASEPAQWVLAEAVALQQILHNLVMNALQALAQVPAPERQLRVQCSRSGATGQVAVGDSGPGIAPHDLAHVFEPFFSRRPVAPGQSQGLGLGLSLCESLATSMGGQLTVAPATPQGAVFTLVLPLVAS